MDWQQVVVFLIVLATVGLFFRNGRQKRQARSACGLGCGCSGTSKSAPNVSVTYRARKGERPQVITRFS